MGRQNVGINHNEQTKPETAGELTPAVFFPFTLNVQNQSINIITIFMLQCQR